MSLNVPPRTRASVPLTLLLVVVLITAGLGVAGTAIYYSLRPGSGPSAPGLGPNRTTVVDDLGRTVSVPLNASRVVILAPSVMDLVYRLGLRDRVVGVGCTVDEAGGMENEYSPNQSALWNLSSAMCVTDYPSLDTSGVALLEPQLVLASTITSTTDVQTLVQTYGLPVVLIAPSSMQGIVGDVRVMAEMFPSVAPTATALESSLAETLANATSFDAGLTANSTPSAFLTYGFYAGTYYGFGDGTFGDSIINLAGGASISSSSPLPYPSLNASAVLLDQPQVILYGTSWNDPYLVEGQTPAVWNSTAPYWSQFNGSKVAIDVTIVTESDPAMILALPWFEYYLHPTLAPRPSTPLP